MSELLNKQVYIKKLIGSKIEKEGKVKILDKVMTNMASYNNSPVINNASMDVYIGRIIDDSSGDGFSIILFEPKDIVKVYF